MFSFILTWGNVQTLTLNSEENERYIGFDDVHTNYIMTLAKPGHYLPATVCIWRWHHTSSIHVLTTGYFLWHGIRSTNWNEQNCHVDGKVCKIFYKIRRCRHKISDIMLKMMGIKNNPAYTTIKQWPFTDEKSPQVFVMDIVYLPTHNMQNVNLSHWIIR